MLYQYPGVAETVDIGHKNDITTAATRAST